MVPNARALGRVSVDGVGVGMGGDALGTSPSGAYTPKGGAHPGGFFSHSPGRGGAGGGAYSPKGCTAAPASAKWGDGRFPGARSPPK